MIVADLQTIAVKINYYDYYEQDLTGVAGSVINRTYWIAAGADDKC